MFLMNTTTKALLPGSRRYDITHSGASTSSLENSLQLYKCSTLVPVIFIKFGDEDVNRLMISLVAVLNWPIDRYRIRRNHQ